MARIWKAIQSLGDLLPTEAATETEPLAEEAPESGTANLSEPEPTLEQSELVVADQEVAAGANKEVQPEPAASEVEANVSAQTPAVAPEPEKATKKATRQKKTPTTETTPKAPREESKTSQVIAMLKREGGTTLEEIMAAMGWQKHTTRAMLSAGGSLTKKHGLVVTSEKVGEKRIYSIKA